MADWFRRWRNGEEWPAGWPSWFWPLFSLGILVNLLPLVVAPILPFADLHGSAGLLGAWLRQDEPAARIRDYFTFNVRPGPNVIYWALGWALGQGLSVQVATNLYIAVLCVAALPVSFLVALRALGKDPALAFLAFPIIYHRCLWYGFVASVPAVPLLLLVIAFGTLAFTHPRFSWRDVALAATLLTLATAHAFLYLVGLGLTLLWALLSWRQPSTLTRRLLVVVPSLLYLGPWLSASLFGGDQAAGQAGARAAGSSGLGALLVHLWQQRPPLSTYLVNAHQWLINGYAGSVDEWVAAIFGVTLLGLLIFGIRPLPPRRSLEMMLPASGGAAVSAGAIAPGSGPAVGEGSRTKSGDRLWESRIPLTAALLAAGYFLLPMTVSRPILWWAVHVRLLVPLLLVAALMIPTRPRGLPRAALLPVVAAGLFFGGYLTHDFRNWWTQVELRGFSSAIAAIPPGKRVHALYPPFGNESHYSHFPMAYIVDYYVVDRGGSAAPIMAGPSELWITWRRHDVGPTWGLASAFRWRSHGPSWDYFLAKQPAPGNGPPLRLFADAPAGAVTKIFEEGLWSVWRRQTQ